MVRRPAKKKTAPLTDTEQSARFIEAAKKAEVDESGEEFERVFTMIAEGSKRSKGFGFPKEKKKRS